MILSLSQKNTNKKPNHWLKKGGLSYEISTIDTGGGMSPDKEYSGRARIRMYNCDCMELMQSGKTWDLAIVDPPFGIGDFEQGAGKNKPIKKWEINWNEKTPDKEYFDLLLQISDKHIIWGANYYNCFTTGGAIVWDKSVTHPDMSKAEIAATNLFKKVDVLKIEWNGFLRCEKVETIHPCQRPVKLHKELLTNYAKPGQTILDTHGGSMSIAIACWDLGFDLDIIELDEDYFNNAVKRFEQHISQTQLF